MGCPKVSGRDIRLKVSTPVFQPIDYNNLEHIPTINGVPIEGDHDGSHYGLNQTYTHQQSVASDEWIIHHNLNRFPSVTIVDTAGTYVVGSYQYVDSNTVICTFSGAFGGTAYLN